MFKTIQNKFKNKVTIWKKNQKTKLQLKNAKRYYKLLKAGALFIKFIQQDIENMKKKQINREQRRRFERELNKKGKFSPEMIDYYYAKTGMILLQIEQQLKPKKRPKIRPGAVKIDKQAIQAKVKAMNEKENLKEGKVVKGGTNAKPTTPRPEAPKGQQPNAVQK